MTSRAVPRIALIVLVAAVLCVSVSAAYAAEPAAADLEALAQAPSHAFVGRDASFSALVANRGPDPATGVRVAIQLSGSFDLVSIVPRARGASCAPPDRSGTIVCELAELPVGDALGIVSVTVNPTVEGEITISASVSANELDPSSGNNTASASVNVAEDPLPPPEAVDLSLRIVAPSEAFVGQPTSAVVVAQNLVLGFASGARLRVTVTGAHSDLRGIFAGGLIIDCLPDGVGTLVCDWPLGLGLEPPLPVLIGFVPTEPGTIRIDAEVSSNEPDLDPSNNVASALLPVRTLNFADLALTLTASPNPVHVGDALTYEVTVVNRGPDPASEVVLDFLGDMRLVSIEPSHGSCDLPFLPPVQPVSSVACLLGRLEPGESVSIRIEALPSDSETFTAVTSVRNRAFGEVDSEAGNDSASVTTEVLGPDRAATFGAGRILPMSLTVFVSCAGDLVVLDGNVHVRFHLTIDETDNGHFETHSNAQGVSGVALGSGATYRATGASTPQQTFSTPLPRTFTFVTNQRLVGQGAAGDLIVHQNVHVSFAPNGEIRTSVDNFRLECR